MNPAGRTQDKADVKSIHGTQKPVECMRRPILNNSSPGQAVYEPFCGSGSTLIACEKEARVCFAMELDQKYCDVIVKRWQDFSGKEARLEDGRTFAELEALRGGKSEVKPQETKPSKPKEPQKLKKNIKKAA